MLKCGRKFKASVGRPDTLLRAASSSADLALGFQPPDSRSPGVPSSRPSPWCEQAGYIPVVFED